MKFNIIIKNKLKTLFKIIKNNGKYFYNSRTRFFK